MTIEIADKTTVGAVSIEHSDQVRPIGDVFVVGWGAYIRVIPNPRTEPDKSFGVYGKNEGFGGWISFSGDLPDKQLKVGESISLTDGITAIGT